MQSRQFPTFDEAIAYLEERGKLEFFGRNGLNYDQWIYNLHLKDGRKYGVKVFSDGRVEVMK